MKYYNGSEWKSEDLASPTRDGLMSKEDKAILDDRPEIVAEPPSGGDDTEYLRQLVAENYHRKVTLYPNSTYIVTDKINVPAGSTINGNGSTLDARTMAVGTQLSQKIVLDARGTRETPIEVFTLPEPKATIIEGISSTATFAVGDSLLLKNYERSVPGLTRNAPKAEMVFVKKIISSTSIELTQPIYFNYLSTSGLSLTKFLLTGNIRISDLNIECAGEGSAHSGINIKTAKNVYIDNVTVNKAEDVGIFFDSVIDSAITNSTLTDSTSPTAPEVGTTGYGICISGVSKNIKLDHNTFKNCRHGIAGGGEYSPFDVYVTNNYSSSAPFDCHEWCFHWVFESNTIEACGTAFLIRGQYIDVIGNTVRNSNTAIEIYPYSGVTEQCGIRVINNTAYNIKFTSYIIGSVTEAGIPTSTTVLGNETESAQAGLLINRAKNLRISNNKFTKITGNNSAIIAISTSTPHEEVIIENNIIKDSASYSINLKDINMLTLNNNVSINPGSNAFMLERINDATISNNQINTFRFFGISLTTCSNITISNSRIYNGTQTGSDCIYLNGCTAVQVLGGIFESQRRAVYSLSTDYVTVANIDARNCPSSTKISVDASNKIVKDNFI